MGSGPVPEYQTLLDELLSAAFDENESGLTFLAHQFAQKPFDSGKFKRELVAKLKRLHVGQPSWNPHKKTFFAVLDGAGLLDVLLHENTLAALWKCLLTKKIVLQQKDQQKSGLAVDGKQLQYHRAQFRRGLKHLNQIDQLQAIYGEEAPKLYEAASREFRSHARVLLISTKKRGSRPMLLTGTRNEGLRGLPKDEELAAKIQIFDVLKSMIQFAGPPKRRPTRSDTFLSQLSELISSPSNVSSLTDGSTLLKALHRRSASSGQIPRVSREK